MKLVPLAISLLVLYHHYLITDRQFQTIGIPIDKKGDQQRNKRT